jgi:hypothetical protein
VSVPLAELLEDVVAEDERLGLEVPEVEAVVLTDFEEVEDVVDVRVVVAERVEVEEEEAVLLLVEVFVEVLEADELLEAVEVLELVVVLVEVKLAREVNEGGEEGLAVLDGRGLSVDVLVVVAVIVGRIPMPINSLSDPGSASIL